jgi:hypothetical protein
MDKNRIVRPTVRDELALRTAKPSFTKSTGGKSGGCARKAVELTSGGAAHVTASGLRMERFILTERRESAEGVVGREAEGH